MDKQGRYFTSGMIEDQYMAGSHGQVLKNLLNITTNREIDRVETELLFVLTDQLMDEFDRDYKPMEKVFTDVIACSLLAYEE